VIRALALTVVGSLVLAALLTPGFHALLMPLYPDAPWPLPDEPEQLFAKIFNRAAMLACLVWLFVLRRTLSLAPVIAAWKHEQPRAWARALPLGLALSALTGLAALPLLLHQPELQRTGIEWPRLLWKSCAAIPAALFVSTLEESFFRVLTFEALKRRLRLPLASLACAAFYASVHFLETDKGYRAGEFSAWSGFEYLAGVLGKIFLPGVWPCAVGVFLIGLVLCDAIQRTRSLAVCIGLHAGWFLLAKATVYALEIAPNADVPAGSWNRYYVAGSPWTWASIVIVWALVRRLPRDSAARDGDSSFP
jgi:membrane protease YdiL (CAAX protease family)